MRILALGMAAAAFFLATEACALGEPLHSADEVLSAAYKSENLSPQEVKVVLLKFDYLRGEWHIELSPVNEPCIDCYPSFHIKNAKEITVETVPHG